MTSSKSSPIAPLQTVRGCHDILPDEAQARDQLLADAAGLLGQAGYRRIETPIMDSTELFARGVGGSTDIVRKEMYSFQDASGRPMTLRPEGTAGVVRSYIQNGMHKLPGPVKLWYSGPFFRFEKAQAGRQRQFSQIGAEVLGSDAPAVEAELIVLLQQLLQLAGVKQTVLRLGSLGSTETRARYTQRLSDYLKANREQLSSEVRERIEINPLRAFDSSDPATQQVMQGAPRLLASLDAEDRDHFTELQLMLDAAGVTYQVDDTLVRGLDYYNRSVFEFSSSALGAQSGVGGGGRYDSLVQQLGGQDTPAAGWGAGVERLLLAGDRIGRPDAPLWAAVVNDGSAAARVAAFGLATKLRQGQVQLVNCDLSSRSAKAQVKAATRAGAQIVVTVLADGSVTLRQRDRADLSYPDIDAAASSIATAQLGFA